MTSHSRWPGQYEVFLDFSLFAAYLEGYTEGIDERYLSEGFMYNIHSPKNLKTGEESKNALATLEIEKMY